MSLFGRHKPTPRPASVNAGTRKRFAGFANQHVARVQALMDEGRTAAEVAEWFNEQGIPATEHAKAGWTEWLVRRVISR